MKYGFGVDLGGTTVKIAYFDETGNLLEKWEIPTVTKNAGGQILPDIAASIENYIQKHGISRDCLLGIGIGVPGPVDGAGVVHKCINLGWGVFNIESALSDLTGLPVKAGNDATLATLGECWKGSGHSCKNMVMITLGTGVGGGFLINGNIYPGAHGAAGELGHLTVNREETRPCGCGRYGCAEQYCSATGIVRMATDLIEKGELPTVLKKENLTCSDVFAAGKAGDPLAIATLEKFFAYMGTFLSNVSVILDPELVVIGGGVSKAGQMLLDGFAPYYQKQAFHGTKDVKFVLATLGNDAGAYGAFYLILSHVR